MTTTKAELIQEIEQASDEVLEHFLKIWQQIKQEAQPETLSDFLRSSPVQELTTERETPRIPGLLVGKLSDQFFEPLPEAELVQWETNI